MSTNHQKNNVYELSSKSGVPIDLVILILSRDSISDTDALKVLNAIQSIKNKGISHKDKDILFGPNMFERVKKVFELLNIVDNDIDSHLPFITGTMGAALGRYWWD